VQGALFPRAGVACGISVAINCKLGRTPAEVGGRMGPRHSAVEVLAHHVIEVKNVVRAKGAAWSVAGARLAALLKRGSCGTVTSEPVRLARALRGTAHRSKAMPSWPTCV
jgi:hypothetical protein